jgi:hypothetical protein
MQCHIIGNYDAQMKTDHFRLLPDLDYTR